MIRLSRDIVLIGGGHAHAIALRRWGMDPLPGARLTLITPEPVATYSGMLPGVVAGHYPRAALEIDLIRLARHAGARIVLAKARDLTPHSVLLDERPEIGFDIASINVGIETGMRLPGAENTIPAKPLEGFLDAWERFAAAPPDGARIAMIGGGAAGVELALAMKARLSGRAHVTLIEAGGDILPAMPALREKARAALIKFGVEVKTDCPVTGFAPGHVETEAGAIPTDFIVTAPGAQMPALVRQIGFGAEGIPIRPTLQTEVHDHVFAAGDAAHMPWDPRPKAGVYAVRQGAVLARNLRAYAAGGRLARYHPQKDYLKLLSLGETKAAAGKWGRSASGAWAWRWKDHIDRSFMKKLTDLPPMSEMQPAETALGARDLAAPLCAGCGAKVAPAVLRDALAEMPIQRPDILQGAGDDAALVSIGGETVALTTDHFRAFLDDPYLLGRIAAIHAMGDIWAMGGQPQTALANLILPRMTEDLQARTLKELLAGARAALEPTGAALVGGHSALGAELTVGFSLTGHCPKPIGLAGAQVGDAILLTKPIGTGVLLAGEMQRRAQARDVAAAWAQMAQSSQEVTAILAPHASAMTDVTGFGLVGHLGSLCRASQVGADLWVDHVPLLAGALVLARDGVRSTLFDANQTEPHALDGAPDARSDLMFDPQTSGGLLATVPANQAERLCAETGAAAIGVITERGLRLRRSAV
ncbi:selenide, water dikinase SelD [Paracoccaceae bacterium GXU_MW_L88]